MNCGRGEHQSNGKRHLSDSASDRRDEHQSNGKRRVSVRLNCGLNEHQSNGARGTINVDIEFQFKRLMSVLRNKVDAVLFARRADRNVSLYGYSIIIIRPSSYVAYFAIIVIPVLASSKTISDSYKVQSPT